MTASRWVAFRLVKDSVSFEAVLDRYGLLKSFQRTPGGFRGPCPLHKGTHPKQFVVSSSKRAFYCFGRCQSGGNVLDFVAKMEAVSIREAALLLAEWFDLGGRGRQVRPTESGRKP